jgi:deoxycytidylate deaminase
LDYPFGGSGLPEEGHVEEHHELGYEQDPGELCEAVVHAEAEAFVAAARSREVGFPLHEAYLPAISISERTAAARDWKAESC